MTTDKQPLWPADFNLPPDHCRSVFEGSYEVPFNPSSPPTILDVGANVGAFVRWAVKRWPGCTIHAYEPEPNNFTLLCETVASLKEEILTHPFAVADVETEATLHEGLFNCGEWSLFSNNGKQTRKVKVIAADSLPKADILKIDAEGAEMLILTQLAKSGRLKEFSAVMLEIHSGDWVEPLRKLFIDAGFLCSGENVHGEHRREMKFIKKELDVAPIGMPVNICSGYEAYRANETVRAAAIIEKKLRVLFATPLSAAGADTNYLRTLVSAVLLNDPKYDIEFASSDCGCVGFARNELAWIAENGGFDKLLQCDDDMLAKPAFITRILSHDVDLVSGAYCKRRPGRPQWLFVPLKGAEQRSDGLLECVRIATGFHALKVSCLTALRRKFPEEEFLARDTQDSPIQTRMNWYKMGISGPRTAQTRLKNIMRVLEQDGWGDNPAGALAEIRNAVYSEQPPGTLYGEDYFSSVMLREAGFRIFVDLGMPVVPHIGLEPHPITPEMVGFGADIPVTLPTAEEN